MFITTFLSGAAAAGTPFGCNTPFGKPKPGNAWTPAWTPATPANG